jgi:hypothetical protein
VGCGAAVTAPCLTVVGVILFTGANSGAHFKPVATVDLALRGGFSLACGSGLHSLGQSPGATLDPGVPPLTFGLQDHHRTALRACRRSLHCPRRAVGRTRERGLDEPGKTTVPAP